MKFRRLVKSMESSYFSTSVLTSVPQFLILHTNLKISGKSRRSGGEVISALKRCRSPVSYTNSKSLNCKNDYFHGAMIVLCSDKDNL